MTTSQFVSLGHSINEQPTPGEVHAPSASGAWRDEKIHSLRAGPSSASASKAAPPFDVQQGEHHVHSHRSKTGEGSQDFEKDESGEGEDLAMSLEEEELATFERRPNLCLRITKRLDRFMIQPNTRKMKVLEFMVSIMLYADLVLTCLLLGNLHYQQDAAEEVDWLGHHTWFTFIIAVQGTDILLNFFKVVVQDVHKLDTFVDKAHNYLKFYFWVDVISTIPYHALNKKLLWLRLVKMARFRSCQRFLVDTLTEVLQDYVANDNLKKWLDTLSMIMMLLLVSHFFACIWILIGMHLDQEETGWITTNVAKGLITRDFPALYVASLYFIILSFSSIGYGDITPGTDMEYQYTLIVQMCGIGIYGYMIGTIQTLFMDIGQDDPLTEQQEMINLWLVKIDRSKPSVILSKKVFSDVRDFYMKKFKHETKLVVEDPDQFFTRLKPRI